MLCASETECRHGEVVALMADGFGGGTRMATALKTFNDRYAKETLDSRSVMIVMSDGYDTDSFSLRESEI
jgi:uncharacterized protein with von Willebrand factor type A (vWA) domain